ncbi:MAG: hypothetical protein ABI167_02310 [Nitrosospira sp.]
MANITPRSPLFGDIARFDPFYNIKDWFDYPGIWHAPPWKMLPHE